MPPPPDPEGDRAKRKKQRRKERDPDSSSSSGESDDPDAPPPLFTFKKDPWAEMEKRKAKEARKKKRQKENNRLGNMLSNAKAIKQPGVEKKKKETEKTSLARWLVEGGRHVLRFPQPTFPSGSIRGDGGPAAPSGFALQEDVSRPCKSSGPSAALREDGAAAKISRNGPRGLSERADEPAGRSETCTSRKSRAATGRRLPERSGRTRPREAAWASRG